MLVSSTLTQIRRDADVFGAGCTQPDRADLAGFSRIRLLRVSQRGSTVARGQPGSVVRRRETTDCAGIRNLVQSHLGRWRGARARYREGAGMSLVRLDNLITTGKRGLSTAWVLESTPGLAMRPAQWTIFSVLAPAATGEHASVATRCTVLAGGDLACDLLSDVYGGGNVGGVAACRRLHGDVIAGG
jgi:hypothetical protein